MGLFPFYNFEVVWNGCLKPPFESLPPNSWLPQEDPLTRADGCGPKALGILRCNRSFPEKWHPRRYFFGKGSSNETVPELNLTLYVIRYPCNVSPGCASELFLLCWTKSQMKPFKTVVQHISNPSIISKLHQILQSIQWKWSFSSNSLPDEQKEVVMDNVPWQLSLQILPWDTDNQTHSDFVPQMFHHCCCSEVKFNPHVKRQSGPETTFWCWTCNSKVSRFDNPVIETIACWWYVLARTITNAWTSKYHWSKLHSVEVRWLSTMSFSDDGKVVKVQPGTKIGTEFSNFTRRNVRDIPLRIKLLVEMHSRLHCRFHSSSLIETFCRMWEVTVLQTFHHPDLSLRLGILLQVYIDFPEEIKDFFFGAQIPPAKPCPKLKWKWRNVEKIPSLEGWTSTYCISYFDLFWCFPLDGVTHQPQTHLAGRGCKDHLRVRTSGCQDGW